jgi:uncharacterized surface protein with fasciclin (FAS1) repeats
MTMSTSSKKSIVVLFLHLVIVLVQHPHVTQAQSEAFNPDIVAGPGASGELAPPTGGDATSTQPPLTDADINPIVDYDPAPGNGTLGDLNYTLTDSVDYADLTDSSGETLMSIINQYATDDGEGLSYFRDALIAADMLDQILGSDDMESSFTVFAPTNAAIKNNPTFMLYMKGLDELPQARWKVNLVDLLTFHIIPNMTLMSTDIFDSTTSTLETMLANATTPVSQFSRKIGGAGMVSGKYDVGKTNGVLHVIDQVMEAEFMKQSLGRLELQPEFGPDSLKRVSLVDVVANVDKSRSVLNQISETGLTQAGCRIRAFNRLEEYLPQTLNDSFNVTWGELLNETFAEKSKNNFLEYSLIAKNYYYDYIPDNFVELVMPISGSKCNAHMWITKFAGQLCFNNGCLIESDLEDRPGLRKFVASNG